MEASGDLHTVTSCSGYGQQRRSKKKAWREKRKGWWHAKRWEKNSFSFFFFRKFIRNGDTFIRNGKHLTALRNEQSSEECRIVLLLLLFQQQILAVGVSIGNNLVWHSHRHTLLFKDTHCCSDSCRNQSFPSSQKQKKNDLVFSSPVTIRVTVWGLSLFLPDPLVYFCVSFFIFSRLMRRAPSTIWSASWLLL